MQAEIGEVGSSMFIRPKRTREELEEILLGADRHARAAIS